MNTSSRMNADAMSGKCGKGSGIGCFIAGTKVKTIEGDRNIEDIEVGDYILAENVETGEQEYKEVTQTFTYEKTAIVHVYVGEEEIETTLEYPFYVEGLGFVSAGELQAGDIIRTSDGRNLPIKKIEIEELEETVIVYNFEVEDFHTYYVSELGVLVHNECPVKTETVKPSDGVVTEGGTKTKDIYRAVGVDEYYDIMEIRKFRGVEGTFAAKEFGNSFEETLNFANQSINKDKVAIIKVTIPENIYNQLHHMELDVYIFKSGTPVVEPDMLDVFNKNIINIEHVY